MDDRQENQEIKNLENKTLEDQIEEWKSLIETLTAKKDIEFYVKAKPRGKFKAVKEVGDYLAKCPHVRNDMEKAWLVFLWVTDNIAYDIEGYKSGNYARSDVESVFKSGLSVCQGYAEIFTDLAKRVGLECMAMSGYSKGFGYRIGSKLTKTDHRWNAFRSRDDGIWRYVESTWGAGHATKDFEYVKEFNPYFFATPPDIFNETHFSTEFYLGNTHKNLGEFEKAQNNKLYFHLCGLKCLNYQTSEIR